MAMAQERMSRRAPRTRVIDAESWIVRDGAASVLRRAPAVRKGPAEWLRRAARRLAHAGMAMPRG